MSEFFWHQRKVIDWAVRPAAPDGSRIEAWNEVAVFVLSDGDPDFPGSLPAVLGSTDDVASAELIPFGDGPLVRAVLIPHAYDEGSFVVGGDLAPGFVVAEAS